MQRILYNSKTGMMAQQEKLDSITNNIANSETDGYKKTNVEFSDLVYETLNRQGYPVTKGSKPITGTGVKANEMTREDTQGRLNPTGKSTDLAIDGNGYFKVILKDGSEAYTRESSFNIDSKGTLVDSNGNKVAIDYINGYNSVDYSTKVDKDGSLYNLNNGKLINIGKINLYNVNRQTSNSSVAEPLLSVGDNLFKPQAGVAMKVETDASVNQGYTEMSNVDIGVEMTDLIITQRAFELNSKGLKTADDMWGMVNNLRGKWYRLSGIFFYVV